jgi:hypothetical protein
MATVILVVLVISSTRQASAKHRIGGDRIRLLDPLPKRPHHRPQPRAWRRGICQSRDHSGQIVFSLDPQFAWFRVSRSLRHQDLYPEV